MQIGEAPQTLRRRSQLLQFCPRPAHETVERRVDCRRQNFVLVLEVQVHGSVCDIRPIGDIGNPRDEESLLGKDCQGGIQDSLVFFRVPVSRHDRAGYSVVAGLYVALRHGRSP